MTTNIYFIRCGDFVKIGVAADVKKRILIKSDGRALWINAPDLRARICGIRGTVTINDMRSRRHRTRDRVAR